MNEAATAESPAPPGTSPATPGTVVNLQGKPVVVKRPKKRWGGLGNKQLAFCRFIAQGCSHYKAYQSAMERPNMHKRRAGEAASRLLAMPAVEAKVREYMNAEDKPVLLSINDRLLRLSKFATDPLIKPDTAIRAIAEYSKLAGGLAPQQHEHSGPGGAPIPVAAAVVVGEAPRRLTMAEKIAGIRARRAARYAPDIAQPAGLPA